MRTPSSIGLPDKFASWRKGQDRALKDILYSSDRFDMLTTPTGSGKCHRRGQLLLKADGRMIRVEDVRRGDRLMGTSGVRTVLSTSCGRGPMYKITPVKGESWVVNGDHVLTLAKVRSGELVDVSVKDWLKWAHSHQRIFKLVRRGVLRFDGEKRERDLPLDPYFLGILLGDGEIGSRIGVSKPDLEIEAEVRKQAKKFGLRFRKYEDSYYLSGIPNRWHPNPIAKILADLGLRFVESGERFVPNSYLTAEWWVRCELLAGLMDTDGHMHSNGYDYISKSPQLSEDVAFLARSLGLAAYVTKCRKGCQNGFVGTYYRVGVSGDTYLIPCRIPRKKAKTRRQQKSVLRTGLTITPLEIEDFFGFTLDGDGRYLLGDFTVTHNSATYMGLAALHDHERVCVLTATRSLQDQLLKDFEMMGLVDMRGRQNYDCEIAEVTAAEAVCTAGVWCEYLKVPGCGYYDQRRRAAASRLVVTNYPYWLHDEESRAIGDFSTLVLDEAHTVPDQISDFAAVEVTEKGLTELKLPLPGRRAFRTWAPDTVERIERMLTAGGGLDTRKRKSARRMQRDLSRLCRLSEQDWVASVSVGGAKSWRWDLIEPGLLAEDLLFRGAKKIVFASASVRRKTLELLGVDQHVSVHEQASNFPVKRRPVYYWPVANVKRGMGEREVARWVEAIDLVIDDRLDRKGIIHSVSYDRAWEILRRSRHRTRGIFIVDSRRSATADLAEEFRASNAPHVLISPAVGTGLDFPYSYCEYQIIPKVPFPDLSSPLVRARQQRDRTYGAYSALQTIVQETGRAMRAEDDQAETFVIDSNLGWLRARHWDFAPRWWHAAVRTVEQDPRKPLRRPPMPPPPLECG